MRRPAPTVLTEIVHPGPKSGLRRPHVLCHAAPVEIQLAAGEPLLNQLGSWAEISGFSSAVLDLGGVCLQPFEYVMPDRAVDDRHVAWYSDTKTSNGATLQDAVVILGWKDGTWFAHIHAFWSERNRHHLGHLLPHTLSVEATSKISGYGVKGACFEVEPDPETEFSLFRVKEVDETREPVPPNALIATLAPFEDLHTSVADLTGEFAASCCEIYGLGSLAGAKFQDGKAMKGLISEILLKPGAQKGNSGEIDIPIRCVDLDGQLFDGLIVPRGAPTLVTCELLITCGI